MRNDPLTGARATAAVVLAAGESKRFRSATPKVLHDVAGRPMLAWVLATVGATKPARMVVVTGRDADQVESEASGWSKRAPGFARQARLLGTADAARTGLAALGPFDGDVLIVPGDTPLLEAATLRRLLARHRRVGASATVLTAELDDPSGYGRIVRHPSGAVARIVEHRDATPAERVIREINAGVYVIRADALRDALRKVRRGNAQNELYLTDVIEVLERAGERVDAVLAPTAVEVGGVNDRAQLAAAAAVMRARAAERLMASGVTIVDPAQTYIDPTVRVKPDTVIEPLTFLTGATTIGAGCRIGPATRIADSRIDDGARVTFSDLNGARVGADASVGPYAYLRPGATLARGAKVGTFVEVKGSTIGEGSKVPHLSYVGDATIGRDVNVGAATVTVNYDPETRTKAKTVVGDGAKIGSDTMLIAPVRVGRRAVTGAGSVVTRDVPDGTVVVGAPARKLRDRKGEKEA